MRRRMAGGAAATIIGNAAYACSQLAVLVILARLTSTEDVGRYALALAVTAPVQIGFGMRLRNARVVTDAAVFDLRSFRRLAVVTAAAATAVSTSLGMALLSDSRTQATIALIAIGKAIESLIDVSYGELQRCGRLRTVAASQCLRGALTVVAVTVGAVLQGGIIGAAACMTLAWTVQYLLVDARHSMDAGVNATHMTPCAVRRLARLTWPLGLAAALTSFSVSSPRLILSHLLDTELLGIFAVMSYPAIVMVLISNSLGQAYLTVLRQAFASRNRARLRVIARNMAASILGIGVLATAALAIVGRPLLVFTFGPQYGPYADVATLMMGAATIGGLASVSFYTLLSTGRFVHQPAVSAVVAVVSIPAVWFPTSEWGMSGTAWGVAVTFLVQWGLMWALARRELARFAGCTQGQGPVIS